MLTCWTRHGTSNLHVFYIGAQRTLQWEQVWSFLMLEVRRGEIPFKICLYIIQSLHATLFLLSPDFRALLFNQNEQFCLKTVIISSLGNKSGLRAKVTYQKVSPHSGFCVWNSILACHCGAICPCHIRAAAAFVCRAIVPQGSRRQTILSCELMLPASRPVAT